MLCGEREVKRGSRFKNKIEVEPQSFLALAKLFLTMEYQSLSHALPTLRDKNGKAEGWPNTCPAFEKW